MAQPARVKFITKRGDWVTETCHDILTCREHKTALDRTRQILNASDKNIITNLLPEELDAETDSPRSVSFEDYNAIPEDDENIRDNEKAAKDVLATGGNVPQYVLNSLSDIMYHMDDYTFFNQDPDIFEEGMGEPDYDTDEPTLGDAYRHPELLIENTGEISSIITHEFNMFGVGFGYNAKLIDFDSEDTFAHSAVKITDEQGRSWVADYTVHAYDESKPLPWITTYADWSNNIGKTLRTGMGLD